MPLGSAQRSVAPSVSVVRSSPTRSAAKGHAQKYQLNKKQYSRYNY
ncbi:MAG: hypothetical protein NZ455_10645 [Bacteroidia bacterium]|nr:hypothetical protein [Bacteroidia bacterium]